MESVCLCTWFKNMVIWKVKCASKSPVPPLSLQVFYARCVSGRKPVPVLTRLGEQQAVHRLQILPEGLLRLRGALQARAAPAPAAPSAGARALDPSSGPWVLMRGELQKECTKIIWKPQT